MAKPNHASETQIMPNVNIGVRQIIMVNRAARMI